MRSTTSPYRQVYAPLRGFSKQLVFTNGRRYGFEGGRLPIRWMTSKYLLCSAREKVVNQRQLEFPVGKSGGLRRSSTCCLEYRWVVNHRAKLGGQSGEHWQTMAKPGVPAARRPGAGTVSVRRRIRSGGGGMAGFAAASYRRSRSWRATARLPPRAFSNLSLLFRGYFCPKLRG